MCYETSMSVRESLLYLGCELPLVTHSHCGWHIWAIPDQDCIAFVCMVYQLCGINDGGEMLLWAVQRDTVHCR